MELQLGIGPEPVRFCLPSSCVCSEAMLDHKTIGSGSGERGPPTLSLSAASEVRFCSKVDGSPAEQTTWESWWKWKRAWRFCSQNKGSVQLIMVLIDWVQVDSSRTQTGLLYQHLIGFSGHSEQLTLCQDTDSGSGSDLGVCSCT